MLFSRKLITKFIPDFGKIDDYNFNTAVNALGMEVEGIYKRPKLEHVVLGQLLEANKVEGTHLSLCKVKVGSDTINQIVCGASNLQVGKKVIVALEGAKLPNGVIISKRQIHGMESNGMICAYFELTNNKAVVADDELDEIIMLDEGEIGSQDWVSLIGYDDTIYDITVPANRNDENSYLVFCYEIAHKLNLSFNFDFGSVVKEVTETFEGNLSVDSKLCSCLAFLDYDVDQKLTSRSSWITKSILMNHGIKPFNYLLDKLAFITILTNCPTNVYDAEKITGELRCKAGSSGLKFMALNSKTYDLNKNDVVIYDQNQPVSLACVVGSEYTKFTNKTTRVKIEVGNFNYARIRNTTIRLNVDTDAAKRASRPLSNYLNLVAIELIKKEFGQPLGFVSYIKPNWVTKWIRLSYRTLDWFINEEITKDFATLALKSLGYRGDLLKTKFKAPLWRLDVNNQEDMFEDILKIIDLNKLKPISVEDKLLPVEENTEYELKQQVKEVLINNYFSEVKTYNLTNQSNLNKFNLFNVKDPVKILCNNSNREYFRTNLIDNMLKVYKYNDARKLELIPIFEIQNLFSNSSKTTNLTCLCLDQYKVDNITKSTLFTNSNYLKAIVNQIANVFNAKVEFKTKEINEFYNNESIEILAYGKVIGYLGKIRKSLLKPYDLDNENIYCLSINIESLFANYKQPQFKVKEFGAFQRLSKDINITLNKENASEINNKLQAIKKLPDIVNAKIINTFEKDGTIVYTIRYYLVDTKQFKTNDIDLIAKEIENLK